MTLVCKMTKKCLCFLIKIDWFQYNVRIFEVVFLNFVFFSHCLCYWHFLEATKPSDYFTNLVLAQGPLEVKELTQELIIRWGLWSSFSKKLFRSGQLCPQVFSSPLAAASISNWKPTRNLVLLLGCQFGLGVAHTNREG